MWRGEFKKAALGSTGKVVKRFSRAVESRRCLQLYLRLLGVGKSQTLSWQVVRVTRIQTDGEGILAAAKSKPDLEQTVAISTLRTPPPHAVLADSKDDFFTYDATMQINLSSHYFICEPSGLYFCSTFQRNYSFKSLHSINNYQCGFPLLFVINCETLLEGYLLKGQK